MSRTHDPEAQLAPLPLFDAAASRERKESGMEQAADAASEYLETARKIAKHIAQGGDGTCNADQVGEELERLGIQVGPWAGSIFRGWTFTGKRIRSTRKSNHAREIKIWRI
jgi:hypothetical protein